MNVQKIKNEEYWNSKFNVGHLWDTGPLCYIEV